MKSVEFTSEQNFRLRLARVLMKNPKILLLDKATEGLDDYEARLVEDMLTTIKEDMVSVVVSHQVLSIQSSNLICVLSHGKIEEVGRFN